MYGSITDRKQGTKKPAKETAAKKPSAKPQRKSA
jgi:hypothetical protein